MNKMIKSDPNNYRLHSDRNKALIAKSLADLGAGRSIVIDNEDFIVAGNGVFESAEALGIPTRVIETDGKELIVVKRTDLTLGDPRRKELALADNATSDSSDWDIEALRDDWSTDELTAWDIELPDFEENEEVQEDGYEAGNGVETEIVYGDLFEISDGKTTHRLLCGDSTDSDMVKKLMGGEVADMVFTDPDFSMPIELLKEAYSNALLFSSGFGFWMCSDKQAVQLAYNDFDNFVRFFVQDFRQATMISGSQAMTRHVMICKFGNKKMNNLKDGFCTILDIATLRTSKDHDKLPMQKRVELPATFIEHYTKKQDIILDLFGHSGSTMVAAHQLNRSCYTQELEPRYCQSIIDRMKRLNENITVSKLV